MNPSRHILQDFDASLESLRADVLMMASLTDRNLQNAMGCLLDGNSELCAVAVADEEEIDVLEKKIDSDGVEILLRFQPVASDLRYVVSTMKVSANLERVADQAVRIAQRSRKLTMAPVLDETYVLGPMFVEATNLFRDSVRAFADENVTLARTLKSRDRELDQINHDLADIFTEKMAAYPAHITDYVNLIFIARHLERVGDHAKNIGEEAVYVAEAEDIRHRGNQFEMSA
jgi:phosphate transport system protein